VSRVAVLVEPRHLSVAILQVEAAARSLGLQITRLEVHGADDIERALGTVGRNSVGALMPLSSALFHAERQRIVRLTAKHRLPAIYEHRDFADAGGLLSYGPDILSLNRRVATYVDRILKGAKPADLPVERPTKFELVIGRHGDVDPFDPWIRPSDAFRPRVRAFSYFGLVRSLRRLLLN
jgi:ABC-type uncharacterized transport system substrate-binding protein